jgi:hypothetical protein
VPRKKKGISTANAAEATARRDFQVSLWCGVFFVLFRQPSPTPPTPNFALAARSLHRPPHRETGAFVRLHVLTSIGAVRMFVHRPERSAEKPEADFHMRFNTTLIWLQSLRNKRRLVCFALGWNRTAGMKNPRQRRGSGSSILCCLSPDRLLHSQSFPA